MEFGYKNPMTFLVQSRNRQGETSHHLIEAGSEKDATRKMKNQVDDAEMTLVTNIKTDGELGQMGHGQLPNADEDIEEILEELQDRGEEEDDSKDQ